MFRCLLMQPSYSISEYKMELCFCLFFNTFPVNVPNLCPLKRVHKLETLARNSLKHGIIVSEHCFKFIVN